MRFGGVADAAFTLANDSRNGSAIMAPPVRRNERRVVELVWKDMLGVSGSTYYAYSLFFIILIFKDGDGWCEQVCFFMLGRIA